MRIPALILAGGLGTRLQHLIPDLPKPMAPVAGKPFLYYLLKHLQNQGIQDVYLSVGHKAEKIQEYFHDHFHSIKIHYIKEPNPLGTGGAIAFALHQIPSETVLILNGDTFLNFELSELLLAHHHEKITIAVHFIQQSNRYGFIEIHQNYVKGFSEKSDTLKKGWINAGVYLINKSFYLHHAPAQKVFSFEKDFLEKIHSSHHIKTLPVHSYFIDIGVPQDYQQAQKDFATLKHLCVNQAWTLFLDRDGVINKKLPNDYVKKISEFEWIEKAIEALKILRKQFGRIFIVTNQQGIGKGIMSESDLLSIHQYMLSVLEQEEVWIDKIYYAAELSSATSNMRKPHIGMALKAKEEFPDIQLHKSIMVGDSLSDIQFAHNASMYAVYLSPSYEPHIPFDFTFPTLYEFSQCFE